MNSGVVQVVVVAVAVGYLLVRRWKGEPAQVKRMIVVPAILGVIGGAAVLDGEHSATSVAFLAGLVVVDAAAGIARGASTSIEDRAGQAYVRYTVITLVLWAVGLGLKFGLEFVLELVDHHAAEAAAEGLLLTLAVGIAAEGCVVLGKAVRAGTRPDWTPSRRSGNTRPVSERRTEVPTGSIVHESARNQRRNRRATRRSGRRR